MGDSLARAFLDSWPGAARHPSTPALDDALELALATARAAWPQLAVAPPRFMAYVGARIDDADDPAAALAALHVEDLYLACACLDGNAAALAAFDANYLDETRIVMRIDPSPAFLDEVRQQLRVHLFVHAQPKIADYSGRGALSAWVRVVALRTAQMMKRAVRRELSPAEGSDPADDKLASGDPELDLIKGRYQREFNDAAAAAVSALGARDRTVLRLHVFERLNIDKIGTLYGVHRATVADWIAAARRSVLDETRRRLAAQLRIEGSDLDSLMGLLRSRLDVHLSQLLES